MRHPSRHAATIADRHRKHDALVLSVLSKEGIPRADVEAEAQEVWLTAYRKLVAGERQPDSWPAYLTTLAQGRAANHRRAARHRRTAKLPDEAGAGAQRLSAEQIVILCSAIDAIPNPHQREAALLRAEGYSIAEIAAKQGISEAGVKKRLRMAGEHLEKDLERDDEDEKKEKCGAFWGFGSFEALIDALSEERERRWKNIEEAIREMETPPGPPSPPGPRTAAPLPSIPNAGPLLPPAPNAVPGLAVAAGKATLVAFVGGALLGVAYFGARSGAEREAAAVVACPEPPANPSVPPSSSPPQGRSPASTMAARPSSPSSPTRPAARTAGPAAQPHAEPDDLEGLLRRAREDRGGVRQ